MFLLLLLVAGLAAGELAGGSFIRLTRLPARFLWLVPLAFALQVIIFWPTFDDGVGSTDVTAGLYLLSLELLLLCVLLNLRLPGVKLLGLGLLLNLTVIAANGGYMPVSLHRLEQVGMEDEAQTLREQDHHLNVTAMADHTRLRFLGDFIPVPEPLPLRSVYSVGDILIAVGGFWLVFRGMTVGVRKALTKRATDRFTSAVEMEGAPRRYSPAEQVDELVRRYRELEEKAPLRRRYAGGLHLLLGFVVVGAASAVVLALVLSDGQSGSSPTPMAVAATSSPLAAVVPSTLTAVSTVPPAPTSTATTPPTGEPAPAMATLVDVRTGVHEGFDRVVFEFVGELPSYDIEWGEAPILADPSGLPIDVSGAAFLRVRFSPAWAHDDAGEATVSALELAPDLPGVVEVTQVGDFEGVVTWVVGLTGELEFEVLELESPFRLVIDVEHP